MLAGDQVITQDVWGKELKAYWQVSTWDGKPRLHVSNLVRNSVYLRNVTIWGTLASEHETTQNTLVREHVSIQGTWAPKHERHVDTLALDHARHVGTWPRRNASNIDTWALF